MALGVRHGPPTFTAYRRRSSAPKARTESRSERRIAGVGAGGSTGVLVEGRGPRIAIVAVGVAQELSAVVMLESFGERVQELDEAVGSLIGQLQRQAQDGQVVRLHAHGGVSGRRGCCGGVL